MKKIFYLILGCLGMALGALGAVLPMLPTVPFLMLAAFCFARSSKRLDAWFKGTRLYREHLADYAAGRGMTRQTKVRILLTVTALMSFGLVMMARRRAFVPCIVLLCVWVLHLLYFCLKVKTIPQERGTGKIQG